MQKMYTCKIKLFITIIILLVPIVAYSQSYEDDNPHQYKNAIALKDIYNTILIEQEIKDPDFYLAIVFPEMMRFFVSRDELETLLTKITYTTINDYEGCSIGPFQIKPSFAENVEKIISQDKELQKRYPSLVIDSKNSFSSKYDRIIRLQNKRMQILYLLAFVDICKKKYNLNNLQDIEQLKVISTAYNVGLIDLKQLEKFYDKKWFPEGKNSESSKWNYSELVIHYYLIFHSN